MLSMNSTLCFPLGQKCKNIHQAEFKSKCSQKVFSLPTAPHVAGGTRKLFQEHNIICFANGARLQHGIVAAKHAWYKAMHALECSFQLLGKISGPNQMAGCFEQVCIPNKNANVLHGNTCHQALFISSKSAVVGPMPSCSRVFFPMPNMLAVGASVSSNLQNELTNAALVSSHHQILPGQMILEPSQPRTTNVKVKLEWRGCSPNSQVHLPSKQNKDIVQP